MKRIGILIFIFLLTQNVFGEEVLDLGKINVLASRTSMLVSDISQGVSIITEEDIEKSTATSLPDVISSQSGIVVTDYLGNPKGVNVDIRGFGETSTSNVLVLVDGRRTNQVDLSGVDWGQIDLDSVERIEILKGPSTVLYGDNACAGVINIVTKKGYRSGEAPIKAGTEFGSYKYKKGFLSAGGTMKMLDYFFNFAHQETNGYRVNNSYWANDFLGNFTVSPTEYFSVDVSTGYHRDRYGMPGALFASEIAAVGREGSTHDKDRGLTSDSFVDLDPKIHFKIKESDAELSIFNSFRDRRTKALNVSLWGRYETLHHISLFELRPKLEIETNIRENILNNLTTGYDFFYSKDRVRSGTQGSAEDFVDITKQTFGLYTLERMEFDKKYLVNIGGRASWAGYVFDQTAVVVNKDKKSITDGAMNCGLGYKYNDNSQIYFDYARSFRFPATDEYYQNKYAGFWGSGGGLNTDLKHQVANNYELGIRDISFAWLKADLNLFLMDIRDEIYYDPITYKNSNYMPLTRHCGVELESRAEMFSGKIKPFVNWTFQNAFFKGGDYSGHKVPFVPSNKVSAGLSFNILKALATTFSMNYTGKCFAISDQANNQAKMNSFVTFDFKMDYALKGFKIWFGVKNMFNRRYDAYGVYSSGAGQVGFYPAEERNYVGGVSYEF
ncbi:MAG: TonB-dependent receptor [Candidatus Omnitrophica bacterium]|nr:TonB-dependent receptor [Candidatus Omnitrophota bacterium]